MKTDCWTSIDQIVLTFNTSDALHHNKQCIAFFSQNFQFPIHILYKHHEIKFMSSLCRLCNDAMHFVLSLYANRKYESNRQTSSETGGIKQHLKAFHPRNKPNLALTS